MTAKIYYSEDVKGGETLPRPEADASLGDQAEIYFYRPGNFYGSALRFKIYDDSKNLVASLKNNSKLVVKLDAGERRRFYAGKPGKNEMIIDIQASNRYYINCEIVQTSWSNKKIMSLVRPERGKLEFEQTKRKQ